MNIKFLLAISITVITFIKCGNKGPGSNETAPKHENSDAKTEKVSNNSNNSAGESQSDGLLGKWKLVLNAFDDNNNGLLDPGEREKAVPNSHSYHFKPDGSCVIMNTFKGRYEVKKENGVDKLYVYRERVKGEETEDPVPEIFRIISISKDELILLILEVHDESSIWIFKRQ